MLISEFIESVEADLTVLGELGGPEASALASRLSVAIEPALRNRFLEALNDLVQEFNLSEERPLTLTLEGNHVRLIQYAYEDASRQLPTTGDLTARIALRVSEELKRDIDRSARDEGISVNSLIVRALDRSLRSSEQSAPSFGVKRLKGIGRG